MIYDLLRVCIHALRLSAVALLLVFAWQASAAAQGDSQDAQPAGVQQQTPAPVKAPPGPVDDFNRGVPRTSVKGFIKALRENDYERAAEYLDLRNLRGDLTADDGPMLARKFGVVLDRTLWIDLESLSEDPKGFADDGLPSYRDFVDSLETEGDRTDILLQRVPRGDGVSIWKFSNATVRQVPYLYDRFGYGPVAERLVKRFPEGRFLGFYVWQWMLVVVFIVGAWLASVILSKLPGLVQRLRGRPLGEQTTAFFKGPLRLLVFLLLLRSWVDALHPPALLRAAMKGSLFLVLAVTWALLSCVDILREHWKQKLRKQGRNQAIVLLPPLTNAVKAVIIIAAAVVWLDNIGFDVTTLITGLGLGGIAFALAAQKSMEDIFGAATLFTAAPVRVGDFCRFGDRIGTVEEIGLRETLIRTLDRTVVSVPNGQFATMTLENYATREKFRYAPRLRLRYGTSPDQVRYIIAKVQELFHAHPKVLPPPAKARFTNFGEHSLEFDVFTYVDVSDFDEFQEIAEDLNLRVMDIVKAAGTDFAVPEQNLHVDRAPKPDDEAVRAAEEQVAQWREKKELPLPHPSEEQLKEIRNTLQYPPEGTAGRT